MTCRGNATALDRDDANALPLQMLDVLLFVRPPTGHQRFEHRVPDLRFLRRAAFDRSIERGQVSAVEVADEVGGAEAKAIRYLLHAATFSVWRSMATGVRNG